MTCCHHLLGVEGDHGEAMTERVVPYLASDSDDRWVYYTTKAHDARDVLAERSSDWKATLQAVVECYKG